MTRAAITAFGFEFRGANGGSLSSQIERHFAPIRSQSADPARVAVCFASSKGDLNQLARGDINRWACGDTNQLAHGDTNQWAHGDTSRWACGDANQATCGDANQRARDEVNQRARDGVNQWACGEDFWAWTPDAMARALARRFAIGGRLAAPNAACASGAHAIALAAQWIEDEQADLVLAGAFEPPQHPVIVAAYRNMGALSKSGVMRPFDARRDGFVAGTGGGFVVLESETKARARGARILGFVSGWSLGCDATHMTQMAPSGETIARAIETALARAGRSRVDYVNAHGTATRNDEIEARALNRVVGARVPVSSTKGQTGHLLGAAGALEAALCLEAMRQNFAPPTLNLNEADPQIELDLVRGAGRALPIESALSLNYGFGGHIGALVFTLK